VIVFECMATAIGLSMVFSLIRVLRGPTPLDRLTGLGLIGTKTVVLLVLLGSIAGRQDMFVDIAMAYALVSFIGVLSLADYYDTLGARS